MTKRTLLVGMIRYARSDAFNPKGVVKVWESVSHERRTHWKRRSGI